MSTLPLLSCEGGLFCILVEVVKKKKEVCILMHIYCPTAPAVIEIGLILLVVPYVILINEIILV